MKFAPNIGTIPTALATPQMREEEELGKMVWHQTLHAWKIAFFTMHLAQNSLTLVNEHPEALVGGLGQDWDFVLVR